MTIRLHATSAEDTTRYRIRREAASLAAAVDHLLDPATAHPVWPTSRSPGRIAVIRGFDRDSRALRDAVGVAAALRGWSVLDVPAVPSFGTIPVADDIGFVVAVRHILTPVAQRCAAFWRSPMLDPGAAAAGVQDVIWQSRPALSLATSGGLYDNVASRFELSGTSRYRTEGRPEAVTSAIAVEPTSSGIRVERLTGNHDETARTMDPSLTIRLDDPTPGTIDGHPQLFPAGDYTITALPQRYHRIVH